MSTEVKVLKLPTCDIHKYVKKDPEPPLAAYDGKTTTGPWANMCEECYTGYGVGLGTGKGHRLVLIKEETS